MAYVVYSLCALTAAACSLLLWSGHRRSGNSLLFWSALCFTGLTLNNLLVLIDLKMVPDISLLTLRNATALISMALLLYGLIWEHD